MSKLNNIVIAARKIAEKNNERRAVSQQRKESNEATVVYMDDAREVTKVAKVDIESYKAFKINPKALFAEDRLNEFAVAMQSANKDDQDSIDAARTAAVAIRGIIKNKATMNIPFVVNADDCKIESMRRSEASDIAGVVYGIVTDKIIIVDHNIVNYFAGRAALIGNTKKEGEAILGNLQKNLLYALQACGIVINGKKYRVWAATSSQQKLGAFYAGEETMMERTRDARMYGATYEEINNVGGDTGAEYLKRQALLFTPSVPAIGPNGETIRMRDILMMGDVEIDRVAPDAIVVNDNDGSVAHVKNHLMKGLTQGDGQGYILVDWLPSCQGRGTGIKLFGINCKGHIEYICKKWGVDAPEFVEDYDHVQRRIKDYKMVLTKSCWKGAKLGITWAEAVERAEKLAEKYPFYDCFRVVRFSDSTEESRKTLTRQSVQQWFNATDEQLNKLARGAVSRLKMQKTLTGALVKYAGFEYEDETRTATHQLFEICPEILCSDQVQDMLYENWNKDLCEAASGSVTVRGTYPYICMDPIAMLEVLLFGMKPTRRGLGVLKEDEINVPLTGEEEKVYFVRYPNNYMMGQVLVNHNNHVFDSLGDVAVLSYYGFAIVKSDGDFDGDEGAVVKTPVVIELMEQVIDTIGQPVIDFPHKKSNDKFLVTKDSDYYKEIAVALWRGQKYNNVGKYSNLATKIMQVAALATSDETRASLLDDAAIAHVGTILVIDMIKTGEMPKAIEEKLANLNKKYKAMPWNQRFNRSYGSEWIDDKWDEKLCGETDYVCDRLARIILNGAGEYSFDKEGVVFNVERLLSGRDDLPSKISKGIVSNAKIKTIRAYNYLDDVKQILLDIQEGKRISPKELMKFFWKNAKTSMAMKLVDDQTVDSLVLRNEYQAMVRKTMLEIGDSEKWLAMPEEDRRLAVVDYFINDAFETKVNNGIEDKGGYAMFILGVFAEDILENVLNHGKDIMNMDNCDLSID